MTVAQILKEKGDEVISVPAGATVMHTLGVLKEHGIGAVLVRGENGDIAGVFSERDAVRALPARGAGLLLEPVSTIMTSDVITCSPDDAIASVMALMTRKRVRHLPVMEDGKLIGLVSIGDVVKHRIAETEHDVEALRAYIALG